MAAKAGIPATHKGGAYFIYHEATISHFGYTLDWHPHDLRAAICWVDYNSYRREWRSSYHNWGPPTQYALPLPAEINTDEAAKAYVTLMHASGVVTWD